MVTGDLIREARARAGLTQAQLAARVGQEQSAIARWERGGALPSFERLQALLRACGFNLSIRLVPTDDSNTDLIRRHLRMTPAERLAQNTHMVELVNRARRRTKAA